MHFDFKDNQAPLLHAGVLQYPRFLMRTALPPNDRVQVDTPFGATNGRTAEGSNARFSRSLRSRAEQRNVAGYYTEGVQAHWIETTVGEHGELVLEGLPFDAGEQVEVLVIAKRAGTTTPSDLSLLNSVLEYHEPMDPVASEDWDALQ